jgi:hypothetical protein
VDVGDYVERAIETGVRRGRCHHTRMTKFRASGRSSIVTGKLHGEAGWLDRPCDLAGPRRGMSW